MKRKFLTDPLQVLNNHRKTDENIIAFFVHGKTKFIHDYSKVYQETYYFTSNRFIFSKFELKILKPNIHVILVSKNPRESNRLFEKLPIKLKDFRLTINIINDKIFEKEVFTDIPRAFKTILLFKKLLIIKGKIYIESRKKEVKQDYLTELDNEFQLEYNTKQEMLRSFSKYKKSCFILYSGQYKELFPNIYKSIVEKDKYGFPNERIRFSYPSKFKLKNYKFI